MRPRLTRQLGGTLVMTAVILLLTTSSAAIAANCRAAIDFEDDSRQYTCDLKSDSSAGMLSGEMSFEDLDGEFFLVRFDLEQAGATTGYCSCKTRASVQAAQFGASRSFFCVTPLGGDLVESMEGLLTGNGKKIKKGQILSMVSNGGGTGAVDIMRLRFKCKSEKSKNKGK